MASGNFSRKIDVQSGDEIGILAETFNDMASQLETTLYELTKSEKAAPRFCGECVPRTANPDHQHPQLRGKRSWTTVKCQRKWWEDFLRVIMNESDRMTKIVQDLLELSRFDAGSSMFTLEKFSLEQSIRDVCDAIALEAKKTWAYG